MSEQTAPARSTTARVGDIALWVAQVALAAYFVYSGYLLFGDDFVQKFEEIGFGQWLRYLTGTLEIAGALGLLVPRLCGLAALGLVGVMAGAVGTELFLLAKGDATLPLILLAAAAVIAFLRRDTIRALLAQLAPDRFGK
ncbi:DoxX family protein [Actinosynnema sp. NPDC047251]|uniref:Putative membrane protein n=1 Tax=Saccharothrix espanaensis (strain ATCC 51144 / DSM 44229 / JCM 9112 / NBRC 15066 / NRRL 15764) TaxID=1179773 RepID=K0JZ51_SACES|nr:DoxX family protein [Saccharothrix espanaensis]CCH31406.1 putative membrane protein [Saccharothrix espanaensis DSM 44229]